MVTQTPRLKLTVDTDGSSVIDTLSSNWNRVDQAAGVIATTSTVVVPNGVLFDGARVAETDTGITWIAKSDGSGGYTKQYVTYPFYYCAYFNSAFASGTRGWGFDNFKEGINATAAANKEPATNYFKATVKGLYSITIHTNWGGNTVGERELVALYNGGGDFQSCERIKASPLGYGSTQTIQYEKILNVGDTVGAWVGQSSGTIINMYLVIFVTMLRPLP